MGVDLATSLFGAEKAIKKNLNNLNKLSIFNIKE